MLDATLRASLIEVLAESLNPSQIDEVGGMVLPRFCTHEILGYDNHITVPRREAASALVQQSTNGHERELVRLVIELEGRRLAGKPIEFRGLDEFLYDLARSGIVYDAKKRKLRTAVDDVSEMTGWGYMRSGRTYSMTAGSIDIAGNSELVRRVGSRKMRTLYHRFWDFLHDTLANYDGRIWNWAGDGGIVAFSRRGHADRAVLWALEIQRRIDIFNSLPDRAVSARVRVRIGLDSGRIKFESDTGRIVSDTINRAAHLEKSEVAPGEVGITEYVRSDLSDPVADWFEPNGTFEGAQIFLSKAGCEDAANG